jgi:hypothetical protein
MKILRNRWELPGSIWGGGDHSAIYADDFGSSADVDSNVFLVGHGPKDTYLLRNFVLKTISLPRQARDKHRKSSQRDAFLQGCTCSSLQIWAAISPSLGTSSLLSISQCKRLSPAEPTHPWRRCTTKAARGRRTRRATRALRLRRLPHDCTGVMAMSMGSFSSTCPSTPPQSGERATEQGPPIPTSSPQTLHTHVHFILLELSS